MEASELRIGNYIQFRHPTMGWSEPTQCKLWMIKDVELIPNSYKPIPITEKWLTDFGFNEYKKDRFVNNIIICKEGDIFKYKDVELHFVHQLQNLYFALTGEELEFNA